MNSTIRGLQVIQEIESDDPADNLAIREAIKLFRNVRDILPLRPEMKGMPTLQESAIALSIRDGQVALSLRRGRTGTV